MEQELRRDERLRGKPQIDLLFEQGKVGKSRLLLVRAIANQLPHNRIASIVGKAAGNAVTRNRIRRRIRAAYRLAKTELPTGWDLVLLARRGVAEAEFLKLQKDMVAAIERATA